MWRRSAMAWQHRSREALSARVVLSLVSASCSGLVTSFILHSFSVNFCLFAILFSSFIIVVLSHFWAKHGPCYTHICVYRCKNVIQVIGVLVQCALNFLQIIASGGSKNFEKGGAEDNSSSPSSFIATAHNEILHGKSGFLKKIWASGGAAAPPRWIRHW